MGKTMKRQIRNFTTTELLVVMAIIAVLLGMGIGVYSIASNKMAEVRTRGTLAKLENALEQYKAKFGYYIPQDAFGYFLLDKIDNSSGSIYTIKDGFCQFVDYEQMRKNDAEETAAGSGRYYVIDGYGGKILYRSPGYFNRDKFDLVSAGANGYIGNQSPTTGTPTNVEGTVGSLTSTATNYLGKGDDIANFKR